MGKRNIYQEPHKPWTKTGEKNRWEATQEFTGDKPFGIVKNSDGRGSMRLIRYYDISEDIEGYFPLMKQRLLAVISECLAKGWITREELEAAIA